MDNLQDLVVMLRSRIGKASVEDLPNEVAYRYINEAYKEVSSIICRESVAGNVPFNVKCVSTNINAGQCEYTLSTPIPIKSIIRIQIKDKADGDYRIVSPENMLNIGVISLDGSSDYGFRMYNDCFFLPTIPEENVEQGVLIWYSAEAEPLCERFNASVEEDTGKKLEIHNIPNFTGKLKLEQNIEDELVVELNTDLVVKLANTSPEKNSLIELENKVKEIFQDAEIKVDEWYNITGSIITKAEDNFVFEKYDESLFQAEGNACVVDKASLRWCEDFGQTQKRVYFKENYLEELEETKRCYTNINRTKNRKFSLRYRQSFK